MRFFQIHVSGNVCQSIDGFQDMTGHFYFLELKENCVGWLDQVWICAWCGH